MGHASLKQTFLRAAWLAAGKDWHQTKAHLEQLLLGNYQATKNGQLLVATTINGQSMSFTQPRMGMSPAQLMEFANWALRFVESALAENETSRLDSYLATKRNPFLNVASFAGTGA